MLADIINGKSHYSLPVVYVSKTLNGQNPVDIEILAKRLKGVAHDPENASWYNAVVSLGTFDGIDVATLTNSRRLDRRSPSYNYLEVLVEGIMENYSYIDNAEAWEYVKSC